MKRGFRREWLGRLALMAASAAAFALVAEGVLRAIDYVPQRHEVRYRVSTRGDLEIRESATVLDCYPSNPRGYFDIDLRRTAPIHPGPTPRSQPGRNVRCARSLLIARTR